MANAEHSIQVGRHRDLAGRSLEPWVRRTVLTVLGALVVVALAGAFGQRPKVSTVSAPAATLQVSSPTRLRGGLLYQARFTVTARRAVKSPRIVLSGDWVEGMTLNTTAPDPAQQENRDGRISLDYNPLQAGERLRVWLEYQVNPTTVGTRKQKVAFDDGETPIVTSNRSTTIFP